VVSCTSDGDELGIRDTICGEYIQDGVNHEMPYFKRVGPSDEDGQNVYLYIWDSRDGDSFCGWWFGSEVGGEEVWLQNKTCSPLPPKSGWQWSDGTVHDEFVVGRRDGDGGDEDAGADEADGGDGSAELPNAKRTRREPPKDAAGWEELYQRYATEVETLDADVAQAVEVAELAADIDLGLEEASVARAAEILDTHSQALMKLRQELLLDGLQGPSAPKTIKEQSMELFKKMGDLGQQVKLAQVQITTARSERTKRREEEKQRTERDAFQNELKTKMAAELEELTQYCQDQLNAVDDEAERVACAAAPLEVEGEFEVEDVMESAVAETEERLRIAQDTIMEARRELANRMPGNMARRPGDSGCTQVLLDFQHKLTALQLEKLAPYVGLRMRHTQKVLSRRALRELSEQVSEAEVEVEKAVVATAPLGEETAQSVTEADDAVASGKAALEWAMRAMKAARAREAQKQGTGDANFTESLERLSEQTMQLGLKLLEAQKASDKLRAGVAAENLVRQVAEKLSGVEVALQQLCTNEILIEELAEVDAEMTASVEAERLAEADGTLVGAGATFGAAETWANYITSIRGNTTTLSNDEMKEALEQLRARVAEGRKKMVSLSIHASTIRRMAIRRGVEASVRIAEDHLQRLQEKVATLTGSTTETGEGKDPEDSVVGGVDEAAKKAVDKAARVVNTSTVSARGSVVEAIRKLRALPGSCAVTDKAIAEALGRLERLHGEVLKAVASMKQAEERALARASLAEVQTRIRAVADEANELRREASSFGKDTLGEDIDTAAAKNAKVQATLMSVAHAVRQRLSQGTQEAMKQELETKETEIKVVFEALAEANKALREWRDSRRTGDLVEQITAQIEQLEKALEEATEAEYPLLTGLEDMASDSSCAALLDLEKAISKAQHAAGQGRLALSRAAADVRQFAPKANEACSDELEALKQRLEDSASKVSVLGAETQGRRANMQKHQAFVLAKEGEEAVARLVEFFAEHSREGGLAQQAGQGGVGQSDGVHRAAGGDLQGPKHTRGQGFGG